MHWLTLPPPPPMLAKWNPSWDGVARKNPQKTSYDRRETIFSGVNFFRPLSLPLCQQGQKR